MRFNIICSLYLMTTFIYGNKYIIDTNQSKVLWIGSKVTGQHYGTISIKDGYIETDNDSIVGGNIIIDMKTINVLDIKEDKWSKKLEDHLKSDDFFSVEKYPFASFQIKNAYKFLMIENIAIEGNIKIKDKSMQITIPSSIYIDDLYAKSIGIVNIDRTKFGITYGSGSFFENLSDRMIYDDFIIKFNLLAIKEDE